MANVGILGAGSWGTANAWLLANNGHQVTLWAHKEATVQITFEQM